MGEAIAVDPVIAAFRESFADIGLGRATLVGVKRVIGLAKLVDRLHVALPVRLPQRVRQSLRMVPAVVESGPHRYPGSRQGDTSAGET